MPRYQCIQFGQCVKADASEEIDIPPGAEAKCPQCGQRLEEVRGGRSVPTPLKVAFVAVPVILVLGGLIWLLLPREPQAGGAQAVESALVEVWPWLRAKHGE